MPIIMCITVSCVWVREILSSWQIHMLSWSDVEGLLHAVSCVCVRDILSCVCVRDILSSWNVEFVTCWNESECLLLVSCAVSCVCVRDNLSSCHVEFVTCWNYLECVLLVWYADNDVSLPPFRFHSLSHTTHTHSHSLSLSLSLSLSSPLDFTHPLSNTTQTHAHCTIWIHIFFLHILF